MMSYALGSQTESMAFADSGIEYGPEGLKHAVDRRSLTSSPDSVLAYAICGEPVRVWAEQSFESDAAAVHDACAAMTGRG